MAPAVKTLFGGGRPKPDKQLEAQQRRQLQDAANERTRLENERADIAGARTRRRSGRALLSFVQQKGNKVMGA